MSLTTAIVRFATITEALASMQRCEAKACSVVHFAGGVLVRTPEGSATFSRADWRREGIS